MENTTAIDVTKLSAEELETLSGIHKRNISLSATNENLREILWALVHAVGRLLDDKYSEGDEAVRKQLWTDMHRTADKARDYLHELDNPKSTNNAK